MIGTGDALAAAKTRATVALADGRTGELIYWPIPVGERRPGVGKRRAGNKARVLMGGRHLTVPADLIVAVL